MLCYLQKGYFTDVCKEAKGTKVLINVGAVLSSAGAIPYRIIWNNWPKLGSIRQFKARFLLVLSPVSRAV